MRLEVGLFSNNVQSKNVGITGNNDGWRILLEQEKVPYRLTNEPDCPVMVFDNMVPEWFAGYMEKGGMGIVTDCNPDFLPFRTKYVADATIEYADLTELDGDIARVQCITRIFDGEGLGKIQLHQNRKIKNHVHPDIFPVFIYQPYGKGGCWYTGLPLSRLIVTLGDTLRTSSSFSDFTERIVAVDKQHIIKAMRSILIKAFNGCGLPYVYMGYYPGDYQSVFTFRIDIDGVYGENLTKISDEGKKYGLPLTFFANKSLCEKEEERVTQIDPMHEVGNHAGIHNLYTDYESNYQNVLECKQWLDHLNVKQGTCFAAPRGMWNYTLHKALEDLGYMYSSDFGFCIDGFPFFPYYMGTRSKVLQIPINPFSVERATIWKQEEDGTELTPEYVTDYFDHVIEENYKSGMPIILYSHPEKFGSMCDVVFKNLSMKLDGLNLWITTLSKFAKWWLRRDQVNFTVDYDPESKQIKVNGTLDADMKIKEIV